MPELNGTPYPDDWTIEPIEAVCDFIVDCLHETPEISPVPTGYHMARTSDIRNGRIDLETARHVSRDVYLRRIQRGTPEAGDIIITREAPMGEIGRVPENSRVCLGQRTIHYRPNSARVDPRYLLFALLSGPVQHEFNANKGAGSVVDNLRMAKARGIPIPLPPLPVQREIAHILGTLDDKIDLNRKMNATLEAMARALFKSWFVDFDPVRAKAEGRDPAGMDAETAALFPDAFEDSPLGEIPRGWRVGTVVDLCESIANGSTPSRKRADYWVGGDIDWFKTGELNDSILIASEEKITTLGLNESSCKLWPESTVLVALYASPTVGRLGMLSKVATANQACSGLVARQDIGHWYVFHAVLFERDRLQSYAVGAAQQNISQRVLSAHPVVVPNHVVCRRYHQLVLSLFERVQLNLEESIALAEMRDTLLPRLMRGELVGV